jgi:hypothetical protein
MLRNLVALAVITAVTAGCDNVKWVGLDVHLTPPRPKDELVTEFPGLAAALATEEEPLPPLPDGPVLLAGTRSGSEATLTVVGEVQGDALGAFASESEVPGHRDHFTAELLAPGSEWVLFAEGVRVGRMTATAAGLDEDFCVPRPTISGTVELVPNAAASQRFLALPASAVSDRTYDPYQAHRHDYDQRVGSLSLAGTAMRRLGAAYPPNGVLAIRQDIQAFQLAGTSAEAIAATFMYRDQLMMSQPDNGAYSLFVMGHEAEQEAEDGYEASYVWYRASDDDPKGAPRFFDHLDWDGDGNEEILLDVFGARSRWFAGLAQRSGTWVRTSEDPCGRSAAPGG